MLSTDDHLIIKRALLVYALKLQSDIERYQASATNVRMLELKAEVRAKIAQAELPKVYALLAASDPTETRSER